MGQKEEIEIVGVVRDVKYHELKGEVPPTVYLPHVQHPDSMRHTTLAVRTAGDPAGFFRAVRQAVAAVDRNLPLIDVRTQEQQIDETLQRERLFARLTGGFATLALLLSAVGLYGVVSYSASRRRTEIGIRMALGAARRDVLGGVLKEGLLLVGAGAVLGLMAAHFATKLIASFLYGLKPGDPLSLAAAGTVLVVVGAAAALIPAMRAARVDPAAALRQE